MLTIIVVCLIAFCALAVENTVGFANINKAMSKRERKKKQETGFARERRKDTLFSNMEKAINERAGTSKRYQKEKLYMRAGLKITYAQGVMISLVLALVSFFLTQYLLDNMFLAFVMFIVAYLLPDQFVKLKKNRREKLINDQIGTFFNMVMKRFEVLGDFYTAFLATEEDFKGEEPMYSEIRRTKLNIQNGMPLSSAMKEMGSRLDNKYLCRFADYYEVAAEIGTEEARNQILYQAVEQYRKNEENMKNLRKQLSEVTMEAYVMLAFVPIVVVYSCFSQPSYVEFITTTLMGKIGITAIFVVVLLVFWFINNKIGAPLDKDD